MTQYPSQSHSQPPSFKLSPTLTSYNLPAQTWLSTNNKTKEYANLATACAVFHPTKPTPHLLILQRASHDSMPNKWELPGGAVDATDETVLHGAARELFEEAGLRVRRFSHTITEGPNAAAGQCFPNRTLTKMFCRFTFAVEAEVDGNGAVEVKLDPNEHQDFVWATEEDVREQGNAERELPVTTESTRAVMLEAFRLKKERGGEQNQSLTGRTSVGSRAGSIANVQNVRVKESKGS